MPLGTHSASTRAQKKSCEVIHGSRAVENRVVKPSMESRAFENRVVKSSMESRAFENRVVKSSMESRACDSLSWHLELVSSAPLYLGFVGLFEPAALLSTRSVQLEHTSLSFSRCLSISACWLCCRSEVYSLFFCKPRNCRGNGLRVAILLGAAPHSLPVELAMS